MIRKKLLILATNINTMRKVKAIKIAFDKHPFILNWTVDTVDKDHVLRIEHKGNLNVKDIAQLIKPLGLNCQDLTW